MGLVTEAPPYVNRVEPLANLGDAAHLPVGASSASVSLPDTNRGYEITGTVDMFFAVGESDVSATTGDNFLIAGRTKEFIPRKDDTHIAAIRDGEDGTMHIAALNQT